MSISQLWCSKRMGPALATLASLACRHPPPPHRWFCRGHRCFHKPAAKPLHYTRATCVHAFCDYLREWRKTLRWMVFTSGWRIGTQPASFSYSSIASTILVVVFAKHCGKGEAALGETNRGGGGGGGGRKNRRRKRKRGRPKMQISHVSSHAACCTIIRTAMGLWP